MSQCQLGVSSLRRIGAELKSLICKPEDCIEVIINENNLTDVQAYIEGPAGTPYHMGRFKVKLAFGDDYPSKPPLGKFLTRIFHPNISEQGAICVNTLQADWHTQTTLREIFRFIRCLLIEPNPDSALNEEAAAMLQENYELFSKTAKDCTRAYAFGGQAADDSPCMQSPLKCADKQLGSSIYSSKVGQKQDTLYHNLHPVTQSPSQRRNKTKQSAPKSRRRL